MRLRFGINARTALVQQDLQAQASGSSLTSKLKPRNHAD